MSSRIWLIVAVAVALVMFAPLAIMWATMPSLPEILPPITPDSPIGIALREGREAEAARDYPRAVARYTAAFLDAQNKPNWYSSVVLRARASAYEQLQQYDHAEADLTAAIKAFPLSHSIYAERGAFYGRLHRDAEALADFRTGAKLDPRSGLYAYTEALLLEERGDHARAIERLNEAIRIEPNVRKYYSERGSAHNFAAMYAEARADYDMALQTPDKHASPRELVRANLGRGYAALQLGLYQQAVDDFDAVIKVVPKASNALAWRGAAHQGLGDVEQASADYRAALALDPKQPRALDGLKALEPVPP